MIDGIPGDDMKQWQKFGDVAISGIYWVAGVYCSYDWEDGTHDDSFENFVSLVDIDYDNRMATMLEAWPIDADRTGDFDQYSYVISHYMEFTVPDMPSTETGDV